MHHRPLRRATVAALAMLLALAGVASADSVSADGDLVTPSIQTFVDLGTVPAGTAVEAEVGFVLFCLGTAHATPGSTIELTAANPVAPTGGSISGTAATIGPVPVAWPAPGEPCLNDEELKANGPSTVTVVAPPVAGTYFYTLGFQRSPSTGLSGTTQIQFRLTVPDNHAPVVSVPANMSVEGDTLGGWTLDYAASATDVEDGDLPIECTFAPGAVLSVGMTIITCTAIDSAGLVASDGFSVTVTDTTAPTLTGVPADISAVGDASGAAVSWADPTAFDVVDGALPAVCAPASGSSLPVGTTTVTCTALDFSGNTGSATFNVTVTRPASLAVTWGEPVGRLGSITVNGNRNLPLKADVVLDGVRVTPAHGPASLVLERLDACGGAVVGRQEVDLGWDGRWRANLDTATLSPGCWRVSIAVGSATGGAFELRVGGGDEVVATSQPGTKLESRR